MTTVAPAPTRRQSQRCESAARREPVPARIETPGSYTADGTSLTKLASSVDPGAWSPDRRLFAFKVAIDERLVEICAVDVSAGRVVSAGNELQAGAPYAPGATQLWSDTGRLMMNHWGTEVDLVEVDPETGGRTKVAEGGMFDVSPDGRRLVTPSGSADDPSLSIVDLHRRATRAVMLPRRPSPPTAPRWITADKVAYHSRGLFTLDLSTGEHAAVVEEADNAAIGTFAFSRDGLAVAWSLTGATASADHGLYIRRAAGPVTKIASPANPLAWSADATALLTTSCDDRSCRLDVIDFNNQQSALIAQTSTNELRFLSRSGWTPDGVIEFGVMAFPMAR
ncbi:MAG TPA: hypothetical protein VM345_16100 [Acidimicrobiales bacterium]|nr:hypothetical protein [Acidimicrobiales bacterium]